MHDNVLLLAEGNDKYVKTLRLSALYSETVHCCLTSNDELLSWIEEQYAKRPTLEQNIEAFARLSERHRPEVFKRFLSTASGKRQLSDFLSTLSLNQVQSFTKFNAQHRSEVADLKNEGILVPMLDGVASQLQEGKARIAELATTLELIRQLAIPDMNMSELPLTYFRGASTNPSACFLIELGILLLHGEVEGNRDIYRDVETLPELGFMMVRQAAVLLYFMSAVAYSINRDCVAVTWDEPTRAFFDRFMDAGMTAGKIPARAAIIQRQNIKNSLGSTILEDTVPDISSLPLDVILDLRQRRTPELAMFRAALASLSTKIDPSLQGDELKLAIRDVIASEVTPSLLDLKAALDAKNNEAIRKALNLTPAVAPALVSFGISAACGIPVDTSVQIGAGIAVFNQALEFTLGKHLEKKDILRSSPWSVIYRLQEQAKT